MLRLRVSILVGSTKYNLFVKSKLRLLPTFRCAAPAAGGGSLIHI